MEIIITSFNFILLLILIVFPLFLHKKLHTLKFKKSFILYLIFGFIVALFLTFLIAWWIDFSNKILLTYYGYEFEAMNDIERYENIKKENFEKIKVIERNMMGIGWPLKAIIFYTFFYFPYFLIVFILYSFYKRVRRNK